MSTRAINAVGDKITLKDGRELISVREIREGQCDGCALEGEEDCVKLTDYELMGCSIANSILKFADEDRRDVLLKAAIDFIENSDPSVTVFYDEADCDGYCLIDDIRAVLGED